MYYIANRLVEKCILVMFMLTKIYHRIFEKINVCTVSRYLHVHVHVLNYYCYYFKGECIGGALVWSDLIKIAIEIGFAVPVLVDVAPIVMEKQELKELIGIYMYM